MTEPQEKQGIQGAPKTLIVPTTPKATSIGGRVTDCVNQLIKQADKVINHYFPSVEREHIDCGLTKGDIAAIKDFLERNISFPSPIPATPVFLKFLAYNLPDGKRTEDESGRILFSTTEPEYEIRCGLVYFNHPGFAQVVMLLNYILDNKVWIHSYREHTPNLFFSRDFYDKRYESDKNRGYRQSDGAIHEDSLAFWYSETIYQGNKAELVKPEGGRGRYNPSNSVDLVVRNVAAPAYLHYHNPNLYRNPPPGGDFP